jgi:hypothetical protein
MPLIGFIHGGHSEVKPMAGNALHFVLQWPWQHCATTMALGPHCKVTATMAPGPHCKVTANGCKTGRFFHRTKRQHSHEEAL